VALNFPGNTLIYRLWMRGLFEAAGANHRLHFLDTPDAICKARLKQRNANGTHPFTATEEDFDRTPNGDDANRRIADRCRSGWHCNRWAVSSPRLGGGNRLHSRLLGRPLERRGPMWRDAPNAIWVQRR
jgi:hypothetical protein